MSICKQQKTQRGNVGYNTGNVNYKKGVSVSPETKKVVAKFPQEVLDKYDFSQAVYTKALSPITGVVCPKHGVFQQYSAQLRKNGAGCPACGEERRVQSRRMLPEDFVTQACQIHDSAYGYGETRYTDMKTKVTVLCKEHGAFLISPLKHLYEGQGCPTCGEAKRGKRLTDVNVGALAAATSKRKHAELFVARAVEAHGGLYDYSLVDYNGAKQAVTILCKKHGAFEQRPEKHLYEAQGCPKCGQKSRGEAEVAAFLGGMVGVDVRNRVLISPREIDIYIPEQRLAVEYCGMYWHSIGAQEDVAKQKRRHVEKHQLCKNAGVRLITLYESEWKEHNYAVRRLLRNAVGKARGRLMARTCELREASFQEAKVFYDRYHPQGGLGNGEHFALFWKGKMVACMRFSLGVNDRGVGASNRTWTLSRYATRITVAGAASRLFKAFLKSRNPEVVKSFSDNRFFDGRMYERLDFSLEQEIDVDYAVWHQKTGVRPKSHYQRKYIPARLKEFGLLETFDPDTDPRSEAEMTFLMGARRIYDCGKKRWVWTPKK